MSEQHWQTRRGDLERLLRIIARAELRAGTPAEAICGAMCQIGVDVADHAGKSRREIAEWLDACAARVNGAAA